MKHKGATTKPILNNRYSTHLRQEPLADTPARLDLPTDYPRPGQMSFASDYVDYELSTKLGQSLKRFCNTNNVSFSAVFLAAFQVLIFRYSQQTDIVIGKLISNSGSLKFRSVADYLNNISPILAKIDPELSFKTLLSQTQTASLNIISSSQSTFDPVIENVNPTQAQSYNPIYQVLFAFYRAMPDFSDTVAFTIDAVPAGTIATFMDLFLEIREGLEDKMMIRLNYNTALFMRETAVQMGDHLVNLLTEGLQDPTLAISQIKLLSDSQQKQLLETWNETAVTYDTRPTPGLIALQARATPNAIAIRYENIALTYKELDERANQVAHRLRFLGVERDTLVGLGMARSADAVVALLGIWKAGGAYVSLDPAYPKNRLEHMVKDSGMPLLITEKKYQNLFSEFGVQAIVWEDSQVDIEAQTKSGLSSPLDNQHRAYVIYTSGSTGLPKGVQIPHQALTNFLWSMQKEPGLSPDDKLASVTTFSFDIHTLELWLPLIIGAEVIIVPQEITVDGVRLATLLDECNITLLQATPATWKLLLDSGWNGRSQLKMLCGGEPLPRRLADQLLEKGGELWNMYGPTETTVWSSVAQVAPSPSQITIGRPIANTQMYILDKHLQPVPIGVTGELFIGGDGVALGYLNRRELTTEKFINNPFAPGIIYNTGDIARYTYTGDISCLGRIDHQVKVRGFRIELGEIGTILTNHPDILDAVVIVREDKEDDKRIVAYIISENDLDLAALKKYMSQALPHYMIPSGFMKLTAFPLTPNGKIDQSKFPPPDYLEAQASTQFVAPETEMEILLANIWSDVLQIKRIGIHDNFFDIGGHSLLAIRIFDQIYKTTGEKIPLTTLFQTPTIAGLASLLMNKNWQRDSDAIVAITPHYNHQKHGDAQPLYFVIPPGDELLVLYDLAQAVAEKRPFLGLQYGNNNEPPYTDVESMATFFVNQLLSKNPDGPYLLGGYCFGGLLAYEMAHQLKNRGKEITLLILVETAVPGAITDRKKTLQGRFRNSLSILKEEGFSAEFQHIVKRTTDHIKLDVWRPIWKTIQKRYSETNKTMPNQLKDFDFINDMANDNYQVKPYMGNVMLIQSETILPFYHYAPHLGWDQFVTESFSDYTIPGDHRTLLYKPFVTELANKIEEEIKDLSINSLTRH